jgi:hypothetical protein
MAAFANLIVPNTCQNAASMIAHGSLPSSEQIEQLIGELDSKRGAEDFT